MHPSLRFGIFLSSCLFPVAGLAQTGSSSSASSKAPTIQISQESGVEVRGDFQVGPTRFVLELDPGETRTVEVQVTSREGEPRSYSIEVEDFSISDDGLDSIQFYGNGTGPFSAKPWIEPAVVGFRIKHGERAFIPIKITVPKDASVGDHYSVVLFQRDLKLDEEKRGGFNLVSRIGALLLLTVKGDVIKQGSMEGFSVSRSVYWSLPAQFSVLYRNTGTVHLTPTGRIDVTNIFGIPVDDIQIKDWYVLRNSMRKREILWQPKFALGYYTATMHLTSAGQKDESVISRTFWIIPALPVLIALLAIFFVSFIVQAFFSHFEIKKKGGKGS